jgi:hypothetical protein
MRNLPQISLDLTNSMTSLKCDSIERSNFINCMQNAPSEYVYIYTEDDNLKYLGGTLLLGEKNETCDPVEAFLKLMAFAPLRIHFFGSYFSYIVKPG